MTRIVVSLSIIILAQCEARAILPTFRETSSEAQYECRHRYLIAKYLLQLLRHCLKGRCRRRLLRTCRIHSVQQGLHLRLQTRS